MKQYFYKNNRFGFSGSCVLVVINTILSVSVAILLSFLIDAISDAINTGNLKKLSFMLAVSVLYAIIFGLSVILSGKSKNKNIKRAVSMLKEDLISAFLSKEIKEYQIENNGTYISFFNHNVNQVEENYFKNFYSIFESITEIVVATVFLILMNPFVAIFSLALMCIPSVIPKLFAKRLSVSQSEVATQNALYNVNIKEIIEGFETIKNYSTENKMQLKNKIALERLEKSKYENSNCMALLYGVVNMASVLTQFSIMLFAGFLSVKGYITIGNIVAVTQLSGQVIAPAFQLATKFGLLKSIKNISFECEKLISKKAQKESSEIIYRRIPSSHEIAFDDVSFSYNDVSLFDGLSFRLEKGGKYALVGKSGSGKSTVLKLLMQYYKTSGGSILIDGKNINDFQDFYKECAYVSQNVFLFNDTLKNNLCFESEVSENELNAIINKVGLSEFVEKLPDGL